MAVEVTPDFRQRSSISSTKPIPPPPSQLRREPPAILQSVVYPAKDACSNLPLMFPSLPEGGTKSRVETQVRLTVDLAHASASSGEPLKYDRVGSWKWLRLPRGTSTKRRTRKEGKIDAAPEDSLYVMTEITCASPPHTKVTCCTSCQAREAKRIERKLAARIRPARSDDESPDDMLIIPGRGKHEDTSKLIQFNCPEVLDFSAGTVILPLRITCYCRHHREKTGFNVHFTLFDHHGRIVGSGITRPIMITDDHKSTGINKSFTSSADATPEGDWPYRTIGERPDVSGPSQSKRKNRSEATERNKKRSKPYDGRRTGKLSRRASNGSINSPTSGAPSAFTTTRPSTPALSHGGSSPAQMSSTVPTTPDLSDHAAAEVVASILSSAFEPSVLQSDVSVGRMFDDIIMPDDQHLSSAEVPLDLSTTSYLTPEPSSALPSLSSPHTLAMPAPQPFDVAQQMHFLFNHDPPPTIPSLLPKIHRLIPSSGPTYGGIEITVLGANFHPNMQLTCIFGDARASSTQRWSDNTLVCLLPPSTTPGVVTVWFDGIQKEDDGSQPPLFAYTDETDRALMELALQVVGLKMTGKIEDARDVAMRIVNTTGPDNMTGGMGSTGAMQLVSSPNMSSDIRHLLFSRASGTGDFEKLILDFLAVIDIDTHVSTQSLESIISHTTTSGQTLLHLAAFLGFSTVVEFLLKHQIDVDVRDKNGFTALHFAAIKDSAACARMIVEAGAALDIVNALGKTPAEVAPAGFFEELFIEDPYADDTSEVGWSSEEREEEAAWGDIEEANSDDDIPRIGTLARRRSDRKPSQHRDRSLHRPTSVDSSSDEKPLSKVSETKKSKEAVIVDEKQVASVMEMLQRTLAQLQYPQGMMPNLPLHLPNLPGMPMWGGLPQMPAVFPVYVPIPALMTLFGDRRVDQDQDSDKAGRNQQWLAQEWKAFLERWIITAKSNEDAPPAYTPRDTEQVVEKEKAAPQVVSSSLPQASTSGSVNVRRVNYDNGSPPLPEEEVKSFVFRPTKKQPRKTQKKHDRMLILFWIPILLIGLIWAFLHSMRVGFHAVKTVLTIKAGLRV
ncbi:hypothetical protein PHLCEN_2v126 [Hermanssonia centrifuga]|uniref:IPT/TIG domain-containing protein n=1 Tax=Hermanssonia centrifuga TaxID=98765 RepID=A0A2R6S6W5_9APHY|nr:hypothetical protein PHLCEN_2v126 [Hermanssonia centrifuga]